MNAVVELDREEQIEMLAAQLNPLDVPMFRKRCVYTPPAEAFDDIQYERKLGDDFNIYHIKTNDTLAEIAPRFGVDVDRVAFINNLFDPKVVFPGSCLRLRHKDRS
jgi:hypothetical protein